MKLFSTLFAVLALSMFTLTANAGSGGFVGEKFIKTVYVKFGGSATAGGESYDSAKSCAADGDLWDIPAWVMIEKVYVIVDTAVTGSSDLDIGDDDSANGFVDGSLSVTLGTTGAYSLDAKVAGGYLRVQTAGATDAGDIYVVPAMKFYKATGKEVKQDITTACTAGRYRVVIEGFYAGAK